MPLSFCLPRLTRGIIFAFLLLGTAYGQDVLETNRGKVVFIQAFPDANMLPTEVRAAGTGVLLKDGYVLTARHFDEQGPIKGQGAMVFQGRIGDAEAQPLKLSYIDENVDHDLLLLRFNPGAVRNMAFACIRSPNSAVRIDEAITIIGFPQAANVTAGASQAEHILDIRSDKISAISAAQLFSGVNVTYGHSGAPVFDSSGRVVGLVRGELKVGDQGTDTAVLVPIERAHAMLPEAVKQASPDECGDQPPVPPVLPQVAHKTVRFTNNRSLTLDKLPEEALVPFVRVTSPEDLEYQLSGRPSVSLTGSVLRLESEGADVLAPVDLYLSSLKMRRSQLLIGPKQVRIFVKDLDIENSTIRAFPEGFVSAEGGAKAVEERATGGRGGHGLPGGSIEIYVVSNKEIARLDVDLSGQAGGQGGEGGPGIKGAPGAAGAPGSDHLFDCARGPGNGQRGEPGGEGGRGGQGGDGGNGGFLTMFFLEDGADRVQKSIHFVSEGGLGGDPGPGGPGGPGGDGGPRGTQTVYCRGGSDGPTGPVGPPGPEGDSGAKGGNGEYAIESIALEEFPIPGLGEP